MGKYVIYILLLVLLADNLDISSLKFSYMVKISPEVAFFCRLATFILSLKVVKIAQNCGSRNRGGGMDGGVGTCPNHFLTEIKMKTRESFTGY